MQRNVRRAAAFALVATLALAAPVIGTLSAVPFALIAVVGRTMSDGPIFEVFARPGDRVAGQLQGLVGFTLAATALALVSSLGGLPVAVFVATTLLVGYGNLFERIVCERKNTPIRQVFSFGIGGALTAIVGQIVVVILTGVTVDESMIVFLAVVGALLAALLRAVLSARDDPVVIISVAVLLWVFTAINIPVTSIELAIAIGIAGTFGYLSWMLGTASVTGMLTGVIISLLTIVLGGYGWFAVLIAFFGLGGIASKVRYDEKQQEGVAEPNRGARGGHNVLGNAAVALVAVIGFAAGGQLGINGHIFFFVFAGSIATALSDTLSSEIGVLFAEPRLITTLEPVEAGTDGGVTLQGSFAGIGGAVIVGVISMLVLGVTPIGGAVIGLAGVAGMVIDSVLGAVIEGRVLGNQSVNFLATLTGGVIAALGAVMTGIVIV